MNQRGRKRHSPFLIRILGLSGVVLLSYPLVSSLARSDSAAYSAPAQDPVRRYLRQYEQVTLNPAEIAGQVRSTGEFLVATRQEVFDVVLEPYDLRSADYRAEETGAGGVVRRVVPHPTRTYRGHSPGFPQSEARFSITEDLLEGLILTPDEWYFIEPRRNFARDADPSEFLVYRRSDILAEAFGTCGTTMAERIGDAHEFLEPIALALDGTTYVAEVATEADYEYVTAMGGSASANSTILDIMNQVDGIYSTQLSVALQVVYQHTWTASDDPYSSTSPSAMLSEFRNHWNANFYSVPFDLAHMWTGKDMDGSTIGIAYLSVACSVRSYSYGVSQRFSSSPGKYILTAHEIGHNFGATHTESANPPQPDCSNTIMNSSIGTSTNFCPYSRNEIATHVAPTSSCASTGPPAPSSLAAVAVSSSQINLTWQDNSSTETGFRIERKVGAGGIWGLAATAGANSTSHSDNGLSSGTTYFYRVQATSASGSSAWSNEASATTMGSAPTITGLMPSSGTVGAGITITGTGFSGATSVTFNWTPASNFSVVSPSQIAAVVPAGAGTGRVRVTTPSGTAVSASDFIVLTCSYSIAPSVAAYPVPGGSGSVAVTASPGCSWTAASQAGWLTITSGSSGNGSGQVNYSVAANSGGSYRSGALAIAGQSFTANQAGVACDLNIDGSVNVLDIQSLINAVLGIGTVPPYYDINQDGGVNVLDLQRLANGILGLGSCP